MRIALISDLHGNEVALDAVIDDIEKVGVDRIVCLGDVATLGPRPAAVIARLRELGCPCILGNHDAFMLDPALIRAYTEEPVVVDAVEWCRDALSEDDVAFLAGFHDHLEVPLGESGTLFLFHGTPRSHTEDLLATTPPEKLDEMLGGHTAPIMACGHTHIQMMRQHRGALIVNPGSVGAPFKEAVSGRAPTILPHAEYATVEATPAGVGVMLRRVELDREALREAVAATDNPIAPQLRQQFESGSAPR